MPVQTPTETKPLQQQIIDAQHYLEFLTAIQEGLLELERADLEALKLTRTHLHNMFNNSLPIRERVLGDRAAIDHLAIVGMKLVPTE